MTDFLLSEGLCEMISSLPKPRLMYRKGMEVKGFFRPYMSFEEYTEAEIFQDTGDSFTVKARFSSMLGEKGSADTIRNIKGFAVRFLTSKGKCDLICQSLPVYLINDGQKFFDMAKGFTKEELFDGINDERLWEFAVKNPESINCILRMFSNRGLIDSYISTIWYSVNTYVWENAKGEKFLVRYRWNPLKQRKRRTDRIFAEFMAGFDPDIAGDELKEAVSEGNFPAYELSVQIADHRLASHPDYLKCTADWNENTIPSVKAGILKITDAEADREEDISFSPDNTIEGMYIYGSGISNMMGHAHKIGNMIRNGRER